MKSSWWLDRRPSLLVPVSVVVAVPVAARVSPGPWLTDALGVVAWTLWLGCAAALALGLVRRRADLRAAGSRWTPGAEHGLLQTSRRRDTAQRYTVRRGDSLWSVAERQLGSGGRSVEIVDLNPDVLAGRPGVLPLGLVLRLPGPAPAESDADGDGTRGDPGDSRSFDVHIVKPGETLAGIARQRLGHPARFREIVEASRDILQPGGERLRSRGVILPGWKLAIPRSDADQRSASQDTDQGGVPQDGTPSAP